MNTNKYTCDTDANGNKSWYRDGKLHREDGPAIEWANGTKAWYRDGKFHREDGPAVEYANGIKYWYLKGIEIKCKSNEEFLRLLKMKAFW